MEFPKFRVEELQEDDIPPESLDVANDGLESEYPEEEPEPPSRFATSAYRGWGPGWPNCQRGDIVTLVCGASSLRLPVRVQVATLFAALVEDLEDARGRPFRPDWSWGFACRAISGTNSPSNHSWGLAIDLDAPENGYQRGVPGPGRNTMPANAAALAARYGCRWGGTYTGSADPMHFEFMGTPTDAVAIARNIESEGKPQEEEMADIEYGQRNPRVGQVQHLLSRFIYETGGDLEGGGKKHDRNGSHLVVDNHFGDKTREFFVHALMRSERSQWGLFGHPLYNPHNSIITEQTIAWLVLGADKARYARSNQT